MKLHLPILQSMIQLPAENPKEIRRLLDDLGLEVKAIEEAGGRVVYNIETLANRGDHLSALGVARELSARLLTPVSYPKLAPEFSGLRNAARLVIDSPLCSRYALLEVSAPQAARQLSLRPEILSCFGESAHPEVPMVDLCNYLQLEIGHPTHAFDLDKVEGDVIVDGLKKEERIVALDGKEYLVPEGAVVIRDRKKVLAVAGVIGCANSMVTNATKRYYIESAAFDPVSVRKTARAMGISTDASYAFERGVDREAILTVLRRLVALTSGMDEDGLNVHGLSYYEGPRTEIREINVRLDEVRRQFNLARLPEVEVQSRLKALGYGVSAGPDKSQFKVQVPSWRLWDVEDEADVVEDVARAMSLTQVKLSLPPLDYAPPAPSAQEQVIFDLEKVLQALGFSETMTKSLYSNDEVSLLEQVDPEIRAVHVQIKNAIEKSCSHLKVTNVIHFARLFLNNARRGVTSFKVYEAARLFKTNFPKSGHPYEQELDILSLAMGGRLKSGEWRKPESSEDQFYGFKGVLEAALVRLGLTARFEKSVHPLLHPGRQARIEHGKLNLGAFGQVHPKLASVLELKEPLMYAELDLYLLAKARAAIEKKHFKPSSFPEVVRDLTLKVGKTSFASEVVTVMQKLGVSNLKRVIMVDDFGRQGEDFRRVSYRFYFQSDERTLTSSEVDDTLKKIQDKLRASGLELAL